MAALAGPFVSREGRSDRSGEDQVSSRRREAVSERRNSEASHSRGQETGPRSFHGIV